MGKIKRDKNSKNTSGKKGKLETTKRKAAEKKKSSSEEGTRKYGYISANSVIIMAEAAGFSGIQEDVARNLAEDVTYRLRYIIQQCKKYMIHSRHKKLSSADINEVLRMCDVPALYGYTVDEPLYNLIYIKDADVFVLDDEVIDLPAFVLNEIMVQQKPSPVLSGVWLKPEDTQTKTETKSKNDETKSNNPEATNTSENAKHASKSSTNHENQKANDNAQSETKISPNLIKYYGITCNTILGHSDLKMVFQDLSNNCKILPIVPYLLNFITIAINKLGSERQIKRLLQTVEALSKNKKIDFTPYSASIRVMNAMLLIVAFDKKHVKISYDFNLRSYASRVLSVVLSEWCCRDDQRAVVIKKMGKLLSDFKLSLKVHYGAITLLTALGPEALKISWYKILESYLEYLETLKQKKDHKTQVDVAMLEEVILIATSVMYRHHFNELQNLRHFHELDNYLFEYFGDGLCNIRPNNWNNSINRMDDRRIKGTTDNDYLGSLVPETKSSRALKYLNSVYKPKAKSLTVDNVFSTQKLRKRKNTRIIFKFAGAIPVPEVNLKRRRLDSRYSQFIAGRKSEGHVVVVGKCPKPCRNRWNSNLSLPVGQIFSIL